MGSLVYLVHHGSFRFRSDLFWRADLGTRGTSGVSAPLLENLANRGFGGGYKGKDVLAGANIRFRYQPEVHIGERVRIFTILDILDNLVLGSTPATGAGSALGLWYGVGDGQAPPTSDVNTLGDSLRVKALWGELSLFDAITVRLGRVPDAWGLGILRNAGLGPDDDFGDAVDRIELMGSLGGFHFGATWDFFFEGMTSAQRSQPLGQPYGYDTADDIRQWVLFVKREPLRPEEIEARQHDLYVARRPVIDWGLMTMLRAQDATSERQDRSAPLEGTCLTGGDATSDIAYDCLRMTDRDAMLWYPDAWARLMWSPLAGHLLRIELELAMVYGHVTGTELLRNTDTSKDILEAGGVLQTEYRIGPTGFGVELGFATGDDTDGLFGILDGSEVVDTQNPSAQSFQIQNRTLTNFKMNRGYHVDQLLYREVIGGITNSWYLKPWVSHTFWEKGRYSAGARLDLLFARAFNAKGTPGHALDLGFETDLTGFFRIGESFRAQLIFAALIPFAGLDNASLGLDAKPALTTQLNLLWSF